MRFLVRVTIPVESGNAMVRDPGFGKKMKGILESVRAQAAYFTEDGGDRTLYLVVEIDEPHEMTLVAEPFFMSFEASVEFMPAMLLEDLQKAAPQLEKMGRIYNSYLD